MKESLVRYNQVGLIYKEKWTNTDIFSSVDEILLDALKKGVIVAVLGRNDERLQIVGESELEMLHCTGSGNLQHQKLPKVCDEIVWRSVLGIK